MNTERRMLFGTPDQASCLAAGRLLQRYLDGELDERAARRVGRHLELCRRCGAEAAGYRTIKRALGRRRAELDPASVARLRRFAADLLDAPPAG